MTANDDEGEEYEPDALDSISEESEEETELDEAVNEIVNWWTSETREFRLLVVDLLSGLPGSDDLAEYFMIQKSKHNCGWKEIDLIAKLFSAINNKEDVEKVSKRLLQEETRYSQDLRDV